MNNNKITLWYITCEKDREVLDLSIQQMSKYDCIDSIIILHTDKELPGFVLSKKYDKVIESWKSYGENIHIAVADGGFNEWGARSHALRLAEMMNTEWLLQCDADEFYTEEIDSYLHNKNIDAVYSPCYSFQTPKMYSINHRIDRGLLDPHIRLWRNYKGIHFIKNKFLNAGNLHIHPQPNVPQDTKILLCEDMCHIHLYGLVPGKNRNENYETKEVDFDWPEHYLDKFKEWNLC